ncbi:MAG: AbrB/MazE/SpoVT family DNA-binding domain-containing protein [Actinobacteria bacterium]|nr:AbrB/MazE/SpoVT family DNA-binding domain-containing protein [Actinomycetota bacterium]NBQ01103.1 AbrB/MazE/SpoVT family DNA-binding domain-containing protein [Actinomycetota bacterium]NCU83933.1 AbrB/MazE/SpoVT family DNA-binding domain-containing protein [Actinomycetota bacterium]
MAGKVKAKKASKKSTVMSPRRGRATSSRISSKNQITIPVEVLREVNLKPGDKVEFMIDKQERIILAPSDQAAWKKSLMELAGSMPELGSNFDYKKERQEWDVKATQIPLG